MQKTRRLMDLNSVFFKCSQFYAKQCQSNTQMSGYFWMRDGGGGGGACAEAKIWKLHKAIHSVLFLASFISFYFEILSYLACGEKIIRLASKNSVKLVEKSTLVISSLSDMLQETLFLLTRYI